jgi:hypothetical protein
VNAAKFHRSLAWVTAEDSKADIKHQHRVSARYLNHPPQILKALKKK